MYKKALLEREFLLTNMRTDLAEKDKEIASLKKRVKALEKQIDGKKK